MLSIAVCRTIARKTVPMRLWEDAAQVARIASWQAGEQGKPQEIVARRRVLDFYRLETHHKMKVPPIMLALFEAEAMQIEAPPRCIDHLAIRFAERIAPGVLSYYYGDAKKTNSQMSVHCHRLTRIRKALNEKTPARSIAA